jgi:hypothetical protein
LLVAYMAVVIGCAKQEVGGGGTSKDISVVAFFTNPISHDVANPVVLISKGMNVEWETNVRWDTSTGFITVFTPVPGALVVASNESTGQSKICPEFSDYRYIAFDALTHGAGESVSLTVITSEAQTTIKGGPTPTPDSRIYISDLEEEFISTPPYYIFPTVTLNPSYTLNWTTEAGSHPAQYTGILIYNEAMTGESYAVILPFSTTSYTITNSMLKVSGRHWITAFPMNKMTFTGAGSNSLGIVKSVRSTYPNVNIPIDIKFQ